MSLTFTLLKPPLSPLSYFSSSTFHGSSPNLSPFLTKRSSLPPSSLSPSKPTSTAFPIIRAMKTMQGRVVCASSDKTVAVEVTRLAIHPKYKRRVRKKKKYQAHDPDNSFKVGDWVQLEECRPISKTKTFLAVPAPVIVRNPPKAVEPVPVELGLPLESQQQA